MRALALELMCERALSRLLVLQAAWKMDSFGNKAAQIDVSAIKLVAAQLQTRVLERGMQVFGAMLSISSSQLHWALISSTHVSPSERVREFDGRVKQAVQHSGLVSSPGRLGSFGV